MSLKGTPQLRARLKALGQVFKPLGRDWGDEYVRVVRPMVPVSAGRTRGRHASGRLRQSFRVGNATAKKTRVVGHYSAYFVDAGVKPHSLVSRKTQRGSRGTIFAKKHPGYRARPFRARAAREALRRKPMAEKLIDFWNGAA